MAEKTLIHCFTGTGNSLGVARAMAAGLGDAEVVSLARCFLAKEYPTASRIGFVFPVYAFGVPKMVEEFVSSYPSLAGARIFAVATMGGSPGRTMYQLDDLLRARGGKLDLGYCLTYPGNCIPLYQAPSPDDCDRMHKGSDPRIPGIVQAIRDGKSGVIESSFAPVNWVSGFIWKGFARGVRGSDSKFRVDATCTSCRLCQRVCPADNIEMKDGKPHWKGRCEACYACLNLCPVQAIQQGWTPGRRRYKHPVITPLELAAFQGRD